MLRLGAAREGLDDEHASAATGAWPRQQARLVYPCGGGDIGRLGGGQDGEQVASPRDVGGTAAAGEQSVVYEAQLGDKSYAGG